ncbi:MAG: Winged helix DNA-binding domain [Chloroflexota bacterium]|jgi:DNA-binding MarR family transcriptional regulator|nr:Winged helix DNA-binding domain [Chloroflexota bacterium]MEA2607653.1 Winged helix DNA-binding domain [Chloroflexota bacterium]
MAHDETDDGWPAAREPRSETRVIVAVHAAHHTLTRRLEISTREHGLDASEALVLNVVLREPACAPWQIRSQVGLHASTLSSILGRLERDGQIERRPSDFDGRRFEVRLTRAGVIAAELGEFVIAEVEDEIAGYTSRAERHGAVAVYQASVAIGRRERGSAHWD